MAEPWPLTSIYGARGTFPQPSRFVGFRFFARISSKRRQVRPFTMSIAYLHQVMYSRHSHIHSCGTTGNSNTTSFPVRQRYTEENESTLYSNDVASFESNSLYTSVQPKIAKQSASVKWVYDLHFQQFGAVNSNTSSFPDNLSWVNNIFQDLLVDICQSAATRSLLLDA